MQQAFRIEFVWPDGAESQAYYTAESAGQAQAMFEEDFGSLQIDAVFVLV